ncbi:MAG: hypothetical protein JWN48_4964 [Myxococcaceae bacterium]|nr:hypothetical protein [Myxococcaceae bacterium]
MNARLTSFGLLFVLSTGCSSSDDPNPASDAGDTPAIQMDAGVNPRVDGSAVSQLGGDASAAVAAKSILPWKEGNTWTYRVTGDGEVGTKVITIGPLEAVGGSGANKDKLANKVVTAKGTDDQTVSWQVEDSNGARVVRLREQSFGAKTKLLQLDEFFEPYKLHVDGTAAHSIAGASWVETYMDTKVVPDAGTTTTTGMDTWSVDAVEQSVTVPAGTFKAIVFIKGGGSNQKTYWYTPGVGKIKEAGGQTEELVSYTLVP